MDTYTFGRSGEYQILVASDVQARERALSLVYSVYLAAGLTSARASRMLLSGHDALPSTTSFLVQRSGEGGTRAVASLTLIPDSPLGLPLEALTRTGLGELRSAGRQPVQLAKLATVAATEKKADAGAPAPRDEILLHLFKLAYLTAKYMIAATDLVIAVAPQQAQYFRHVLLFEALPGPRCAPAGPATLAVPLRLRLETAEERYEKKYGRRSAAANLFAFFVNSQNPQILEWLARSRRPLDTEEARYLFAERTELLARIDEAARRLILGHYPGLAS